MRAPTWTRAQRHTPSCAFLLKSVRSIRARRARWPATKVSARAAKSTPTIPPNTYPTWSSEVAYDSGAKVERSGVGYLAKWASRGEDPAADVDNPWQTPWQVITPEEAAADRADAPPGDG